MNKPQGFNKWHLESFMEQVEDFKQPKFKLEQYFTPKDQTVELFSRAHLQFNAFKKKVVGDFCCGTGMFSVAAEFFKPKKTVAFDIDEDAIKEAWDNFDYFEIEEKVDLVQVDLSKTLEKNAKVDRRLLKPYFDTIMMNPPFGTTNPGIDMKMLQAGYHALKPGGQIFSIHKLKKHKPDLTKRFITKFCAEHFPECKLSFLWQFEFPLPKTYKHQKKELGKVDVIVIRILKQETDEMVEARKEALNRAFKQKTDQELQLQKQKEREKNSIASKWKKLRKNRDKAKKGKEVSSDSGGEGDWGEEPPTEEMENDLDVDKINAMQKHIKEFDKIAQEEKVVGNGVKVRSQKKKNVQAQESFDEELSESEKESSEVNTEVKTEQIKEKTKKKTEEKKILDKKEGDQKTDIEDGLESFDEESDESGDTGNQLIMKENPDDQKDGQNQEVVDDLESNSLDSEPVQPKDLKRQSGLKKDDVVTAQHVKDYPKKTSKMFGELFESFLKTCKGGTKEERVAKCKAEFVKYSKYWEQTQSDVDLKKLDKNFQLSAITAEFNRQADEWLLKGDQAPQLIEQAPEESPEIVIPQEAAAYEQDYQERTLITKFLGKNVIVDSGYKKIVNLTQKEAIYRSQVVSDVVYNFQLILLKGEYYFGKAEITFDLSEEKDLFLELQSLCISDLQINDGDIITTDDAFKDHRINLTGLKAGKNTVKLSYLNAYSKNSTGLHTFTDQSDDLQYLYTQFEPYFFHKVFPGFDQPDIRAKMSLQILCPPDWLALSNEVETLCNEKPEETSKFLKLYDKTPSFYQFAQTPSIAPYLFAVIAGPYAHFKYEDQEPTPQRVFVRQSLKNIVQKDLVFGVSSTTIKFYEEHFGQKYPFSKVDHVFCPDYKYGAMENVGCITYSDERCVRKSMSDFLKTWFVVVIQHELCHMWFGNLVTMRWWNDLWLNEAFATCLSYYVCLQGGKHFENFKDKAMIGMAFYKRMGLQDDLKPTTHNIQCNCPSTDTAESLVDGITYGKGSSMIKQLIFQIGWDKFSAGLKNYFQKHKWQNTELTDFISALQESWDKDDDDLTYWAKSWLQTKGCNKFRAYHHEYETHKGKFTSFMISQTHTKFSDKIHRRQMINIGLYNSQGKLIEKIERVWINDGQETFVPVMLHKTIPAAVLLNEDDWGYGYFKLDESSIKVFEENLHQVSDPLNRAVIIGQFISMIRQIEYPVSKLVPLLNQLFEEKDQQVLLTLSSCLTPKSAENEMSKHSLNHLFPLEYKTKLNLDVADFFLTKAKNENKEMQVFCIDQALPFCTEKGHMRQAAKWITSSKIEIDGQQIECELTDKQKYTIVKNVFASYFFFNAKEKQEILEKAFENDNSDAAQQALKICKINKPDPEVKENLWNDIVTDQKLSLFEIKTKIEAFWQPQFQMDVIEPYIEKYFHILPRLVEQRDRQFSNTFMRGLSPASLGRAEDLQNFKYLVNSPASKNHAFFKRFLTDQIELILQIQQARKLCPQLDLDKPVFEEQKSKDEIAKEANYFLSSQIRQGRENKNPFLDYDVIGFQAIHTLVQFKTEEISKLLIQCTIEELTQNDDTYWCEELLNYDFSGQNTKELQSQVWDVKNGNLLVIDQDQKIIQGSHGPIKGQEFKDTVKYIYGEPPVYSQYKFPNKQVSLDKENDKYWALTSYFDLIKAPIINFVVELIDKGKIKKTYEQFAYDLVQADFRVTNLVIDDKVQKIAKHGRFYPRIFQDPEKYIMPMEEANTWLQELKMQGKKLFVMTNFHSEFFDLIMKTSLGVDYWQEHFDVCLCNCRTPLFQKTYYPFYALNLDNANHKGDQITSATQMIDYPSKYYVEGNGKILTDYFQKMTGKEKIKLALVGEHYLSDIHATHELNLELKSTKSKATWDAIVVTEAPEIKQEQNSFINYFVAQVNKFAKFKTPFTATSLMYGSWEMCSAWSYNHDQHKGHLVVTGGLGYLGSHTIVELQKNSTYRQWFDKIIILDNLSNSKKEIYNQILKVSKATESLIQFVECDLLDRNQVNKFFTDQENIQSIFHFAKPLEENQNYFYYKQEKKIMTENILKAMQEHKINDIIFSSSSTVYGQREGDFSTRPVQETDQLHTQDPYGKADKLIEDMLYDSCLNNSELSAICMRRFSTSGYHPSGSLGKLNRTDPISQLCRVATGHVPEVKIHGRDFFTHDGTQVRDYIHITDCARAFLQALLIQNEDLNIRGWQAVNVGCGKGTSTLELINIFEGATNVNIPYSFVQKREGDRGTLVADISMTKANLDWEPRETIVQMCRDTWNYYLNNKANLDELVQKEAKKKDRESQANKIKDLDDAFKKLENKVKEINEKNEYEKRWELPMRPQNAPKRPWEILVTQNASEADYPENQRENSKSQWTERYVRSRSRSPEDKDKKEEL